MNNTTLMETQVHVVKDSSSDLKYYSSTKTEKSSSVIHLTMHL
jgi:hypothetical protein